MKKYFIILLLIASLTGCNSKNANKNINTIIEKEKNILIGMNYPVTGIASFDKIIQKDIKNIYNDFKKNYESFETLEQSELNIDYTYFMINEHYINITLHIFINSSMLANPINYMKSYVFDIQQKKILTIHDLIQKDDFSKFVSIVKKELLTKYKDCILLDKFKATVTENYEYPLFTFDSETLTIYFNPTQISASYCDILEIEIPLSKISLKIPITPDIKLETTTYLKPVSKIIDSNQKVVALTFDDGPSKYTKEILKILQDNEACATFFVIGNKVEAYKDTMQLMVQNGNEIGNHSYNHKWLTKLNDEELKEQIDKTQEVINSVTGYTPTIIRPTYGSISKNLRKELPLDVIMWTVDTSDWKYKSVEQIFKEATKKTKDLDVILMHDTHERTVKALNKIIPELKKQGFQFVTVSELKEVKLLREQKK